MKRIIAAAALVAALPFAAGAQSGAEVGTLTCKLTGITNVVVYTSQEFDCSFNPSNGTAETYTGKISKIGIDLSIKNDITLVWAVVAPTNVSLQAGSLAGTYVGASADVAVVKGAGGKILVGGGENSFSLQPLSVTGIDGSGVAVGIESFTLTSS